MICLDDCCAGMVFVAYLNWCFPVAFLFQPLMGMICSHSSLDNNCLWKVYLVLLQVTETTSIFWCVLLTTDSSLDFGNAQFFIKSVQPAAVTAWSETLEKKTNKLTIPFTKKCLSLHLQNLQCLVSFVLLHEKILDILKYIIVFRS